MTPPPTVLLVLAAAMLCLAIYGLACDIRKRRKDQRELRAYDEQIRAWAEQSDRDRHERIWCAVKASQPTALWSNTWQHPHRHLVYSYPSLEAFHADVEREVGLRAGVRRGGER